MRWHDCKYLVSIIDTGKHRRGYSLQPLKALADGSYREDHQLLRCNELLGTRLLVVGNKLDGHKGKEECHHRPCAAKAACQHASRGRGQVMGRASGQRLQTHPILSRGLKDQ